MVPTAIIKKTRNDDDSGRLNEKKKTSKFIFTITTHLTLCILLMAILSCSLLAYLPFHQLRDSFRNENGINRLLDSVMNSTLTRVNLLVTDWSKLLSDHFITWKSSNNDQSINHYVSSVNEALSSVKNIHLKAYKYNSIITELVNIRNNLAQYINDDIFHSSEEMKKRTGLLWMIENQWRLDDIIKLSRAGQTKLAENLKKAQLYLPVNPSRDGEFIEEAANTKNQIESIRERERVEKVDGSEGNQRRGNHHHYLKMIPETRMKAYFKKIKSGINDNLSNFFDKNVSTPLMQTLITTNALFITCVILALILEYYQYPRMNIISLFAMAYAGYSIWMTFGDISIVHDEYVKNCKPFDINQTREDMNYSTVIPLDSNMTISITTLKSFIRTCMEKDDLINAVVKSHPPGSYFDDSLSIQNEKITINLGEGDSMTLDESFLYRKLESLSKVNGTAGTSGKRNHIIDRLLEKSDLCIKAMNVLVSDPEEWQKLKRHLTNHKLAMDDFIDNYTIRHHKSYDMVIGGWTFARECIEHIEEMTKLADSLGDEMKRVCKIQRQELESMSRHSKPMLKNDKKRGNNRDIILLKSSKALETCSIKRCKPIVTDYMNGYQEMCSRKM